MNLVKQQLILLDEDELLGDYTSGKYPYNVIIQNPFRGIVEFVESQSEKLQILINATYNADIYPTEEVIKYSLNKYGDNVNLKLMTDNIDIPVHRSTVYTSNDVPDKVDFMPLYLLFAAIALLVFLTFILSSLFAYWWNKNKRPHIAKPLQYKVDADSTKHPLLISEPNTPHLHNQMHGSFLAKKDGVNSPDLTAGNCQLINPLRFNPTASCSGGVDMQGNFGINDRMPFVLTGAFDDYPLDNMDLMNSINARNSIDNYLSQNSIMVSSNLGPVSYSTLPLNFTMSHGASVESVNKYRTYNPNQVRCSESLGHHTISSSNLSFNPNRHLAKEFLDDNLIERIGMNVLPQISESDVSQFNIADFANHIFVGKQCPLDSVGIYQQLSNNTGQGSDETSGILSDSSGSTLDRPAQSSNAMISSGFSIVPSVMSSGERFVSLDSNDQRYIPLSDVIAEVANCPQHSYLIKSGQFPVVNVPHHLPQNSRMQCTPQNMTLDWSIPSSNIGPPMSLIHGVQIHGTPLDSRINSGSVSHASSFQTVLAADEAASLNDNMNKIFTSDCKQVYGTVSRNTKSTPKPARKDITRQDNNALEQQLLIESQKYENTSSYEYEDDIAEDDESGASTSPRSALKGSRHGPRVSKQLRFTSLGLLFFMSTVLVCCSSLISGVHSVTTPPNINSVNANYVIDNTSIFTNNFLLYPLSIEDNPYSQQSHTFINVKMTVFVPRSLMIDDKRSSNKVLKSFQLYTNQSSSTILRLGVFKRTNVDIFDMRNSLNILTPDVCRQRYSCSHTCDPGQGHRCICQRGYSLASDGKTCIDINECSSVSNVCGQYGGLCVNVPGSFECLCNGEVCEDCSEKCPQGYFKNTSCQNSKYLQCSKCTAECSPGYYISKKCSDTENIQCRACRPLCITGEFELSPCSGTSNRVCQGKSTIMGIELPDKKNVWYEDRRNLRDITHIISFDESSKLSQNRVLLFERESGYQIRMKFEEDVSLFPLLEPVDHSSSNDNNLFKINPSNKTLKYMCPYPVPPTYFLNMLLHSNVTTEVVNDPALPGYRPTQHPCSTYIQHGEYPDPEKEINRVFHDGAWPGTYRIPLPSAISCLDSGKLPAIFGEKVNEDLALREGIYVEEKHHCSKIKTDCQKCLIECADTMISNSLVCKPTGSSADNGRSPRLENCFDCCARDNCTVTCEKYATQRCAMHLCMTGPRIDVQLAPDWPRGDNFICHMKLSSSKPIFSLKWSLYKDNKQLTMDEFHETMMFTDITNNDHQSLQIKKVFRDLIEVKYTSNIDTVPDIISGTVELQNAYLWSTEKLPLTPGIASLKVGERSTHVKVWPQSPLGVNSGLWSQMSKYDCNKANNAVDKLNVFTQEILPYRQLSDIKVERATQYVYKISNQNRSPSLNFTISAKSSLLGAIFSSVWVHREQFLSASLIYLGAESSQSSENNQKGYWIVELIGQVSNFPGYFRLQLWNADILEPQQSDAYQTSKDNSSPLLDYDVGVFEEKNFKIHLRLPAPPTQPNFSKSFMIKIIDIKGELEILVHRAQQDTELMKLIEKYRRAQDGKYAEEEPSILPEVMALSGQKSLKDTSPFGIPSLVMFSVLAVIIICLLLLLIGHLTRKEEHLCEDIVFKTRHIVVFVVYMVLKSVYCFSVTTTALLIIIVMYTKEPYYQLTSQSSLYINSTVSEKLLMDRMDAHLEKELSRQLGEVTKVKEHCDKRLVQYYQNLNQRLEEVSSNAAIRRSRVLISQAVIERAQYELRKSINQLTHDLEDFNRTAKIYMKKIQRDMEMTKKKLSESEWLEAARRIYDEVVRQRNKNSGFKKDPTKSFLAWLKITGELPESPPQLTLPSSFPFPDWAEMNIPIPEPRVGSGLDAEYGPEYKPFNPKDKDLELEQSIWSYYDAPDDVSKKNMQTKVNQDGKYYPGTVNAQESSENSDNTLYTETIETLYKILIQLSWCHLLTLTLLLDLLWLLHRIAHTMDTAEQIFYGYPCFIDCTVKGHRRRRRNENNFKFMLKRTFCETMESSFVPKFCGSAFALFIMYLLSSQLNELISEEALDYVGYYDNMALPAHLRNRFVNTQVVQSAQQLNDYELASYELFIHQRQSEIQDILNSWVDWTSQLEQYQCEILKQYKTDDSGKLISEILNKPEKVPIPTHCKISAEERQREKEKNTIFKMSVCPVSLVIPKLFMEYNETEVSLEIVSSSRHWLQWTRRWVDIVLQCVFAYISAIILWNTVGATVWFFIKRFSLIRQKRIYETDLQSMPMSTADSDMKSSNLQ